MPGLLRLLSEQFSEALCILINYLSRWLGHSSIQTTLIYLEIVPDPTGSLGRCREFPFQSSNCSRSIPASSAQYFRSSQ